MAFHSKNTSVPTIGMVRTAVALVVGAAALAAVYASPQGQTRSPLALREFSTTVLLEADSAPSGGVSIGDLDRDGDLDVVLAKGRHDPHLNQVLTNNGPRTFESSPLGPLADRTYVVALGDVDDDGDLDAVIGNDRPDPNTLLLNNGRGQFEAAGSWGDPSWSTRNIVLVDLDGDKAVDALVANRQGESFACFNDGRGRFERCGRLSAESAAVIVAADFDRDGSVDAAVAARDSGQGFLHLNDGRGRFSRGAAFGPSIATVRGAAASDLNADGWPDLVVADVNAGAFIYLNDGRGALQAPLKLNSTAPTGPYAVAISDLNNDRIPDVILGYADLPGLALFGDGTGVRYHEMPFGDGKGIIMGLAVADLDADGFSDIVAARSDAPNVTHFGGPVDRPGARIVHADRWTPPAPSGLSDVVHDPASPILGTWYGSAADGRLKIEMTLDRLASGMKAGSTSHSGIACEMVNTLQGRRGDVYVMTVEKTAGVCPNGIVQIMLVGADRLQWQWFPPVEGAKPEMSAILERKRDPKPGA